MQDAGSFETAVVIGGGTMGRGIAQVAAAAGYPVTLTDNDAAALERALEILEDPRPRARGLFIGWKRE